MRELNIWSIFRDNAANATPAMDFFGDWRGIDGSIRGCVGNHAWGFELWI